MTAMYRKGQTAEYTDRLTGTAANVVIDEVIDDSGKHLTSTTRYVVRFEGTEDTLITDATRLRIPRDHPAASAWTPEYAPWRHGGWYVTNLRYPSGAVGCVSRNYTDRKWRIVCQNTGPGVEGDRTFPTRDAAARAERELAEGIKS